MGFLENQDGGWMMEHREYIFLNKSRTITGLQLNNVLILSDFRATSDAHLE